MNDGNSPIPVLLLALAVLAGPVACSSDGGISYDSLYEGLTGDEPAPTPSQAVSMAYDRSDADARRRGVGWLSVASFGGEPEYLNTYRLLFTDPDPTVRAIVAKALGTHGQVEDASLLVVLLEDEDPFVRWQAGDALRKIHNPAVARPMAERLDPRLEDDADTRAVVADALGQYADRVVFSRLVAALNDRSYTVVDAARRSLVTLTGHDAGLDPRDWAAWGDPRTDQQLFVSRRPYAYSPYPKPRGWTDHLWFWTDTPDTAPRTPTGLEVASSGD